MIETIKTSSPKLLGLKLCGKLHDEDYEQFVPKVETLLTAEGKLRLFAQFEDFHGWDLHAAWDDLKFGLKHYSDFERIAMVGDRKWEKWMARFCRPFTKAKVKYFDRSEVDVAWRWLAEDEQGDRATDQSDRIPNESDRIPDAYDNPAMWNRYMWYGL
jgi:hypothetical protein